MSLAQLAAFGVAALVLIAIPRPSVVFVVGRALTSGRGVVLLTVLGNSLGLLVVLVLVALGLGLLVRDSVTALTALPQLLDRGAGDVQAQMPVPGGLAFLVGLCSDSIWADMPSGLRSWINASPRRGGTLGAIGGMSMIGLGLGVSFTGRPQ